MTVVMMVTTIGVCPLSCPGRLLSIGLPEGEVGMPPVGMLPPLKVKWAAVLGLVRRVGTMAAPPGPLGPNRCA